MPEIDCPPDPGVTVVRLFQGTLPPQPGTAPGDLTPVWPPIESALLSEQTLAVPAFPLETLPEPWRTWISDTARSVNVPSDYVAQAVLAAIAGICGAGIWVSVSSVWSDPLALARRRRRAVERQVAGTRLGASSAAPARERED